ncbi:hypothetical protein PTKIN_Ptkin10aG0042700 [Pterospermum kingtungense]
MPVLRRLEIVNCWRMKMLPDGLRFITTLQELTIKSMSKAFKDKLVQGGEDFYKVQHVPSMTFQDCDRQEYLSGNSVVFSLKFLFICYYDRFFILCFCLLPLINMCN